MQLRGVDGAAAQAMMAERENRGQSIRDFYREMQGWAAPRLLVDKTPEYAMDLEVLRRAEAFFDGAIFVHLARHPLGMIRSYEQGRFLLESPYRGRHDFDARQLAELTWLISHRNIREFLREVPAARQRMVRFEDVLASPEAAMRTLGDFLGVGYDPGMITPYTDGKSRMTDGAHALSQQVGDPNFYRHGALKPEVPTNGATPTARIFSVPPPGRWPGSLATRIRLPPRPLRYRATGKRRCRWRGRCRPSSRCRARAAGSSARRWQRSENCPGKFQRWMATSGRHWSSSAAKRPDISGG